MYNIIVPKHLVFSKVLFGSTCSCIISHFLDFRSLFTKSPQLAMKTCLM